MSAASAVTDAKKALRKTIKAVLSTLSEEELVRQSAAAQRALMALPQYQRAVRIGIYLSMPNNEARTEALVRDALGSGKTVFVPYIHKPATKDSCAHGSRPKTQRSVMEMLRLRSLTEWQGLAKDAWGIPSLDDSTVADRENAMGGRGLRLGRQDDVHVADGAGLDLVVMPGVAFDRCMRRLGHGAGFYDSYLSKMCDGGAQNKPYLVGLCLAEQFLPESAIIPTTDSDWKVDAIAVGDGSVARPKNVA